jgi:hypothetical protein
VAVPHSIYADTKLKILSATEKSPYNALDKCRVKKTLKINLNAKFSKPKVNKIKLFISIPLVVWLGLGFSV